MSRSPTHARSATERRGGNRGRSIPHRRWFAIVTAVLTVCLAVAVLSAVSIGTANADGHTAVEIEDTPVPEVGDQRLGVTLSDAPSGLSGAIITVTVDDSETLSITGVEADGQFELAETSVDEDGTTATFSIADADGDVGFGNDIRLAELIVEGESLGEADIEVTVHAMDDNDGEAITPATPATTVEVTDEMFFEVGPEETHDFERLSPALEEASDEHTVLVHPGTYEEPHRVDSDVTIEAVEQGEAVIESSFVSTLIIEDDAAPTIDGIRISGEIEAIVAGGTTGDWTLRNVVLENNEYAVSTPSASGDWEVRDSTIRNNDRGILATSLNDGSPIVQDSLITGNERYGISATRSDQLVDARENDWGQPEPGADQCRGLVDCGDLDRDEIVVAPGDEGDFDSIDTAIAVANDDGTVLVREGTYSESVTVDTDVTITGEGGAVIDGEQTSSEVGILIEGDAEPEISGLTLRNHEVGLAAPLTSGDWRFESGTLTDNDVGLFATETTGDWQVTESTIEGNAQSGIEAWEAEREGDATGNWWGDEDGPEEEQCVGNVDCGDPVDERPDTPGEDSTETDPEESDDEDETEREDELDDGLSLEIEIEPEAEDAEYEVIYLEQWEDPETGESPVANPASIYEEQTGAQTLTEELSLADLAGPATDPEDHWEVEFVSVGARYTTDVDDADLTVRLFADGELIAEDTQTDPPRPASVRWEPEEPIDADGTDDESSPDGTPEVSESEVREAIEKSAAAFDEQDPALLGEAMHEDSPLRESWIRAAERDQPEGLWQQTDIRNVEIIDVDGDEVRASARRAITEFRDGERQYSIEFDETIIVKPEDGEWKFFDLLAGQQEFVDADFGGEEPSPEVRTLLEDFYQAANADDRDRLRELTTDDQGEDIDRMIGGPEVEIRHIEVVDRSEGERERIDASIVVDAGIRGHAWGDGVVTLVRVDGELRLEWWLPISFEDPSS